MLLGHGEVVHHRDIRCLEPLFAHEFALLVGDAECDIARGESARLIAEEVEFTARGVEPRVRRHRLTAELAVVVPGAARLERMRIELDRAAVLLQGEEPPAVPDWRRVVDASPLAANARIVGVRIAIQAIERAASGAFVEKAFGADVALLEIDVAVFKAQQAQHAVAAEVRVVSQHRRVLRIGNATEPGPVDLARQFTFDDKIVDIAFDARRRVVAAEVHRFWKRSLARSSRASAPLAADRHLR